MQSFLGFSTYYRNHIRHSSHIASSLYKLFLKDEDAPVLILPDFKLLFNLYIDAACSQGLEAALHQRQIVDDEPKEGVICYISRKLKDSEARYGATQTECLFLVWALKNLHYFMEGAVVKVYTDFTAFKSVLSMKTTNRHMLRWQIDIQEYGGNMNII
ncbi:hypothetical protein O181_007937 [Austropuccinia psidii MF-1]|uniref:Reverse transcriptase RNase H-like domain-containing protein n=1 Tax=Austropuccinia psidii MF-1 TaxID=1389203 RepID=A0A9Q3GIZ2_9BASI|nr:hypothetical protein [Austropuccinia psidii MF-1]